MADLPTRLDLFSLGRQYVLSKATQIDPTKVDVDGSNVNIVVGSSSVMVDAVTRQLGYCLSRTFLDGCFGEDLDRWAYDRYQQTRKGAAAALGAVRVYRASLAGGSGSVPVGTTLTTLAGVQYVTTSVANFSVSQYTSSCSVRASQAGHATQVGRNQITKFANPSALFDATLQVNNDLPTAGGENAESDDVFKLRLRKFWLTARRGILSAIEQGATSVPGVTSARAVEALTGAPLPARLVNLYIADSSGVGSAELASLVRSALDDYRAGGIPVIISTSIPTLVGLSFAVEFQAGVNTLVLAGQIRAAVVEFVNSLGVNQPLLVGDLFVVLSRFKSAGTVVSAGSILSPAGDLVPTVGQTLRTVSQLVLVNGS